MRSSSMCSQGVVSWHMLCTVEILVLLWEGSAELDETGTMVEEYRI